MIKKLPGVIELNRVTHDDGEGGHANETSWDFIMRKRVSMWRIHPDSKVHGANMGPIWGQQHIGGPHVGPMSLAIWIATFYLLCTMGMGMGSAKERKLYNVTSSLIGWAHALNNPCAPEKNPSTEQQNS